MSNEQLLVSIGEMIDRKFEEKFEEVLDRKLDEVLDRKLDKRFEEFEHKPQVNDVLGKIR